MKSKLSPKDAIFNIFKLTSFLLMTIVVVNCKNRNDENPNCGCNSEVTHSIPESANLVGSIYFKTQLDPKDNYYNNKFWIIYTEPNCVNCIHHMIVCNENILPADIIHLKNTGGTISVKFLG